MELVLVLLAFAVTLGLTVKRVGLGVYTALFVFAALASTGFLLFYRQLFA